MPHTAGHYSPLELRVQDRYTRIAVSGAEKAHGIVIAIPTPGAGPLVSAIRSKLANKCIQRVILLL